MNRRLFLVLGCSAVVGCRSRKWRGADEAGGSNPLVAARDPAPDRWLFEEHWSGFTFDRVEASYHRPVTSRSLELARNARGESVTQPNPSVTRFEASYFPTAAQVSLRFNDGAYEQRVREVAATLYWPMEQPALDQSARTHQETRTAPLYFEEVHEFLREAGRFRVDDSEPYFRYEPDSSSFTHREHFPTVDILVAGPNERSKFERRIAYDNSVILDRLLNKAWPELV
ncbi:MAG: hypothetical protein R3B96_02070 [Pirellulaceae bacterium]